MDAPSLTVARDLGFQVNYNSNDDNGAYAVTRLSIPDGADTFSSLRMLRIALPGKTVALNSLFRIFRQAGAKDNPASPLPTGGICTDEQCQPRTVIGWNDYLRGCSAGLAMGMIDTGVDASHPALAGGALANRIVLESFRNSGTKPSSKSHGTGVAALLVGDAARGVAGLVPDVTLYAADVFYADGDDAVTDTVSLLRALDWLQRQGVRLVNMSFTGPNDPVLAAAISQAVRGGMIIIAAAGNDGSDAPPAFPAAYPGVIAVTAVTSDLKPYQRANHGNYIALSAPGVHIWTAAANGKGAFESGTSFAAPYVTAIVATVLRAAGSRASSQDIIESIPVKSLGAEGASPVFGRGLAMAPTNCGTTQTAEQLPWTDSTASFSSLLGFVSAPQ